MGSTPNAMAERAVERAAVGDGPLRDRVVLLTGATGGLGREMARTLAAGGAHLALSARDAGALEAFAKELCREHGIRAAAVAADLRDPDEVAGLIARAERAVGPIDVLVNNASIELAAAFERTTAAELAELVQVNLTATLELTRAASERMLARGSGRVVLVSSLSGYTGTAYEAPYAATKGALVALARSLRAEYAGRGVDVSLVAPGAVGGTGMFARAQADGAAPPRAMRLTTPDAVARAVAKAAATGAPPELLVYPGPVRPLLALGLLAPRTGDRLNVRTGVAHLFRPAAVARGRA